MPTKQHKKRPTGKPGRRPSVRDYAAALWSTPMACEWSGLKHKYILDLIRSNRIPSVAMGPDRVDTLPDGRIRPRACAKYMVPSKPFREFVESLGTVGKLQRSA